MSNLSAIRRLATKGALPSKRALLIGTALATSLLVLPALTAAPALAQDCTPVLTPGPDPINQSDTAPIVCVTGDDRVSDANYDDTIYLQTTGDGNFIDLTNSGMLTADEDGIDVRTYGEEAAITVNNTGAINAGDTENEKYGHGIDAYTDGDNSAIAITNSGVIIANEEGIETDTNGDSSAIFIDNRGAVTSTGEEGITAETDGDDSAIDILNSGAIVAEEDGIEADSNGENSAITILNSGAIVAEQDGIQAYSDGANSAVSVTNSGALTVEENGIVAVSYGDDSAVTVNNSGVIVAGDGEYSHGIDAFTEGDNSSIEIYNIGAITALDEGIETGTDGDDSSIFIENSGFITSTGEEGITADTDGDDSAILIINSGAIVAQEDGIEAESDGDNSAILIFNSGNIVSEEDGIETAAAGVGSPTFIFNDGAITTTGDEGSDGIDADAKYSDIAIVNSAAITTSGNYSRGISANIDKYAGPETAPGEIVIINSGNITTSGIESHGIYARTNGDGNSEYGPGINGDAGDIYVGNSANITVTGAGANGIAAYSTGGTPTSIAPGKYEGFGNGNAGDITVNNSGTIEAENYGVYARTESFNGVTGDITITNTGVISGGVAGIVTNEILSPGTIILLSGTTTINNSNLAYGGEVGIRSFSATQTIVNNLDGGVIAAGNNFAIDINGGPATINNAGLITGFVDLTDNADSFENRSGGVFETFGTSEFGGGNDLFNNQSGGLVDASGASGVASISRLNGVETFVNSGLISMIDGREGDQFIIANTPGGEDASFVGNNGLLGVDAFLGGPGSQADVLRIEGDVSGRTGLIVNNTNTGPGVLNEEGILVVRVEGETPTGNEFFLADPIDTGFFNYDLFFEETGSGNYELRSFLGGGAFILPQLASALEDIWHTTSDTWFDRSADLRTAMRGGEVYGGGSLKDGPAVVSGGLSPAVWARGSVAQIDRDGSAGTSAFGRNYSFDLERELSVADFQSGIDFAVKGLMNPGDTLLLSVFGGGVMSNLQYDRLDRRFDIDGGQVGVAATYLSGGLFVDSLFNAQFLEVETDNFAFPEKLDAETYGFRIDSGYRFQMSRFYLEPLLTLSVSQSEIDGFRVGGNSVAFEDESAVRGRVGLRAGTSTRILGVQAEPYVIASLWSNLDDDDNTARLTSSGTTFTLADQREDTWGEISFGTHYFLPGNNAVSAFTKTDVTFGDDLDGYAFKGGFRVQW